MKKSTVNSTIGRRVFLLLSHAHATMKPFWDNKKARAGLIILAFFVTLALLAPYIAPYDPQEISRTPDGTVLRMAPPSLEHLLGTTDLGRDIFSQLLMGSRPALLVGFIAALITTFIGTNVALIAGYYGGLVDEVLMRLVDIAYVFPFEAFAIALVMLLQPSITNVILAISLLFWRGSARVVRSEVLSLRERTFIKAVRATGAGDLRIIYRHLAPNILPLAFLYLSINAGWAIIAESSLSFIGLGDPKLTSWGTMMHFGYIAGAMRNAWWWVIPPGICIAVFVTSLFLISNAYEEIVNPRLRSYAA